MDLNQAYQKIYHHVAQQLMLQDPVALAEINRLHKITLTTKQKQISHVARNFPLVQQNNQIYWGGSQHWLPRNTQQKVGCGPVAATNVLVFFARKNQDFAASIGVRFTPQETIAYDVYLSLLEKVYKATGTMDVPVISRMHDKDQDKKLPLSPSLGQPAAAFVAGTLRYALKCGVLLGYKVLNTAYANYQTTFQFIQRSITHGKPIVMLTNFNRHKMQRYAYDRQTVIQEQNIANHFMTIVGVKPMPNNKKEVIVSSWGQLWGIDYDILYKSWQSPKAIGSILVAFTQETDINKTKKQIYGAYGMSSVIVMSSSARALKSFANKIVLY